MLIRIPLFSGVRLSLFVLTVAATGCTGEPESAAAAPGTATVAARPSAASAAGGNAAPVAGSGPTQQSLEQIARKYEDLQAQADQTNRQMVATLSQYQRRGGKLPPNFGTELSKEQRDLLAFLIMNERADTRDLLQDILDKDTQISDLKSKMQSMRGLLPDYTVAKQGDRHDRLAVKYLTERGVARDTAETMVAQVSLQETLLPGFNVWTYYADGRFGTWVTKGTAPISPQQQQQRVVRELTDARLAAEKASATLKGQLETVREEEKKKVESALEQAKNANAETSAAFEMLEAEKEVRRKAESTILYIAGSKRQLERQGVIRGNRVIDTALVQPTSVDVTGTPEILIQPGPFELGSVKKVTLLPDIFVQGRDYSIRKDGGAVRVQLLNLERFRRNQFILVVE